MGQLFSNHILHIYKDGEAIIKKTFTISLISSRDDGTKTTLPSPEMNLWKMLHHLCKKAPEMMTWWWPCIHLQRWIFEKSFIISKICELEKSFTISTRLENHVSISRDVSLKKASPSLRDASLKKSLPSQRDASLKSRLSSPWRWWQWIYVTIFTEMILCFLFICFWDAILKYKK